MKKEKLEKAINELSSLLRSDEKRESKYQDFFENNSIVFEVLGYIKAYPKPRLPKIDGDYIEPDFIVQQVDGLYQIFELKTPQEKLVQEIKNRDKIYASVDKHISQVHTYSEYFDDREHRELTKKNISIEVQKKPDMVLVVGRDENVDKKLLHLIIRRKTNALHIVTYDDILSRLQFHHAELYGHTENLSGVSWHGIITLRDVTVNRKQFIFDAGNSVNHSRWSLFINERKHLCFEILDVDGVSHSISLPINKSRSINWNAQSYVCCEFGSSDNFSIMQLLVDNRLIMKNEFLFPISLPIGLDFNRAVIMADIEQKNHGTLTMAGLAIYNKVLNFKERNGLTEAIFDKFFTPPSLIELISRPQRPKYFPNQSAHLIIGEMRDLEY